MPKQFFFLLLFSVIYLTGRIKSQCCFTTFDEIYSHCQSKFPQVANDESLKKLQPHNIHEALNGIKDNHDAKCFVHCLFNSIGIVNENGDMSDGKMAAPSSLEESENVKKITKTSESASASVVKQCEGNVKKEKDPCQKTFELLLCLNS